MRTIPRLSPQSQRTPDELGDRAPALSRLGRSGLEITRIGLGAWAIGGSNAPHSWSRQEDADSLRAIEKALDLGINWIDTAAIYGQGHSEELIGAVVEQLPSTRRPYVFTKCAAHATAQGEIYFDLSRDSIRREVEWSLTRLRLEAIDLYQIHRPTPESQIDEGWRALVELRDEGLVKHIGVSNFDAAQLRQIEQIAPVETIQPPYSLLRREAEDALLPFARERGIGVIGYSPLGSGLLAGSMTRERLKTLPESDWRRHDGRFAEPTLSRGLALAERLRAAGRLLGVSAGAVAIAWALENPAVHGVIVGFRSAEQVEELARAALLRLPAEVVTTLEEPVATQATTL
jgi:aryl-alcohol dehydrogenase-like predicted oxidoreductase